MACGSTYRFVRRANGVVERERPRRWLVAVARSAHQSLAPFLRDGSERSGVILGSDLVDGRLSRCVSLPTMMTRNSNSNRPNNRSSARGSG